MVPLPLLLLATLASAGGFDGPVDTAGRYQQEKTKGDLEALPYRRRLNELCQAAVNEEFSRRAVAGMTKPTFVVHPRMISKYGKGHEKAYEVVPVVARRWMRLHALLRAYAADGKLTPDLARALAAAEIGKDDAALLARSAADVEELNLGFWGYFNDKEKQPEVYSGRWFYFIRTNDDGTEFADPGEDFDRKVLKALLPVVKRWSTQGRVSRFVDELGQAFRQGATTAPR